MRQGSVAYSELCQPKLLQDSSFCVWRESRSIDNLWPGGRRCAFAPRLGGQVCEKEAEELILDITPADHPLSFRIPDFQTETGDDVTGAQGGDGRGLQLGNGGDGLGQAVERN